MCVYFFIPIRKKKQKRFAVIWNIQQQKNQSQFALNLSLLPSSILLFSPRRPESYGHTPEHHTDSLYQWYHAIRQDKQKVVGILQALARHMSSKWKEENIYEDLGIWNISKILGDPVVRGMAGHFLQIKWQIIASCKLKYKVGNTVLLQLFKFLKAAHSSHRNTDLVCILNTINPAIFD